METTRLPSLFIKDPNEIFAKVKKPLFIAIIAAITLLRAWKFGKSGGDGFQIVVALIGFFVIGIIIIGSFFATGGRKLSQLVRYSVLYFAFTNNISLLYLERIKKITVLFEVRDDFKTGEKFKNAIALWLPNASKFLLLLIPFVVLLVMSVKINEGYSKKSAFAKWHKICLVICLVLSLLPLPFQNMTIGCTYVIQILLICIIWSLWECIRNYKTLEPIVMVSWAEIALFVALFLKGVVDVFGL